MNDAEIIKALEYCVSHKGCADDCPCVIAEKPCVANDLIKLLNLIKRQQAEIERLKKIQQRQADLIIEERGRRYELASQFTIAKSEAIKEFAEKLKANFAKLDYKTDTHRKTCDVSFCDKTVNWIIHDITSAEIDNLVEEMTRGADNV